MIAVASGFLMLVFASENPATVGCLAAIAVVLFVSAARRPSSVYLWAGGLAGLGLAAMTPFVRADGGYRLVAGPEIALIDTEVTAPELVDGLVAGGRVFAVAVLIGVVLAQVDGDRLHHLVARAAPGSAMLVALAARLAPALERDAVALAANARGRGLRLGEGGRVGRARAAGTLVTPLVGSTLERGLDIAEAMAMRGYGGGRLTRVSEPALDSREVVAVGAGAVLAVTGVLVALGPLAPAAAALVAAVLAPPLVWAVRT